MHGGDIQYNLTTAGRAFKLMASAGTPHVAGPLPAAGVPCRPDARATCGRGCGSRVGASCTCQWPPLTYTRERCCLCAGACGVRTDMFWSDIQPTAAGGWDAAKVDFYLQYYQLASSHGLAAIVSHCGMAAACGCENFRFRCSLALAHVQLTLTHTHAAWCGAVVHAGDPVRSAIVGNCPPQLQRVCLLRGVAAVRSQGGCRNVDAVAGPHHVSAVERGAWRLWASARIQAQTHRV